MNFRLFILITLILPALLQAQTSTDKCSVNSAMGEAIKQRMLHNRSQFTKAELEALTSKRTTTYVPLTIHNVANSSGQGRTSINTILAMLCGLNDLYATQNVKFFIHGPIRNITNNFIDANAFSTSAAIQMATLKISGTVNIYVGRSVNNPSASFYSPGGDYCFFLQAQMSADAKTAAHELGHFFTLAHTFNGWEGIDAEANYGGGNAPFNVGGRTVERVNRAGAQANCSSAADGFCDTHADYYSDRTPCPYNPTVKDPYGNALTPDETNIMSYASDNCVDSFTTEQKAAVAADIAIRTWGTQTPNSTAIVTGTASAVSPLNQGLLGPISDPTVRIDWTDVTGAVDYYVEVYGTNFFGINFSDIKYQGIVYGASHLDLSTSGLVAGSNYAWRVKAFNGASTCANFGPTSFFQASATVTSIKDLPIEQQMKFEVGTNPITTDYIPFNIYSAEDMVGSIRLYSIAGNEVLTLAKQNIDQGESTIQLPAADLSNGVYVAILATERGFLQQKIVIQR